MEYKENFLQEFLSEENLTPSELNKRQQQIIDAAVKIFSEKGFSAARTSDIAKEAQVAEGTIFRYYKTKRDLLLGLIIPFMSSFIKPLILNSVEKIVKNSTDKTIDETFNEIFLDRLELVKKNGPVIKTILIESNYDEKLLTTFKEKIVNYLAPMIDNIMLQNIENGKVRDDIDPRLITRSAVSMLGGYIYLSKMFPEMFAGENEKEEIAKIVDILLDGIRNKNQGDE